MDLIGKTMLVAGVDEAGRGPLVGPVSVAAVILPLGLKLDKINDSKKYSKTPLDFSPEWLYTDVSKGR